MLWSTMNDLQNQVRRPYHLQEVSGRRYPLSAHNQPLSIWRERWAEIGAKLQPIYVLWSCNAVMILLVDNEKHSYNCFRVLWWIWSRRFFAEVTFDGSKVFFVPYGFSSFNDFQLNLMALKWRPTNVPFLPSNTIDLRPAAKNARTYSPFCLGIHLNLKQNWPILRHQNNCIFLVYTYRFEKKS